MKYLISMICLTFVACALPQKSGQFASHAAEPTKALIYIYRMPTSIDAVNPDIPRVYVNDEKLGKIRIGGYYVTAVEPGELKVYYKDSLIGIPTPWTGNEIDMEAKAGQSYYFKYETAFAVMTGKTTAFLMMPNAQAESEIKATELLVN
jgi:hypothetical protein